MKNTVHESMKRKIFSHVTARLAYCYKTCCCTLAICTLDILPHDECEAALAPPVVREAHLCGIVRSVGDDEFHVVREFVVEADLVNLAVLAQLGLVTRASVEVHDSANGSRRSC